MCEGKDVILALLQLAVGACHVLLELERIGGNGLRKEIDELFR